MDKAVIYLVKGLYPWESSWIESAWSKKEDALHEQLVLNENSNDGNLYYVVEVELDVNG